MIDSAVSTAYNRVTRVGALVLSWRCSDALHMLFCARMQTDSLNVFRRLVLDVILRTRGALCDNGRSVTVQDMCAEKPRRFVPKQDHVMAAWRGHEAVGVVVSPTVRARPHRESCLFRDDVVSVTTHLVWLVIAPTSLCL